MIEENEKCPVTGLPITQKPHWIKMPIADDFVITYRLIGDRILHAIPSGHFTRWNVAQAAAALDQVLNEAITPKTKFVQITDFKNMTGTPTRSGNIAGIHYFEHRADQYLGAIAYHVPRKTKLFLHVAWRIRKNTYPFDVQEDYESAVQQAQQLLKISDHHNFLKVENFVSRPEWQYQGETLFTECKVLDGKVLYALHRGYLKNQDVEPVSQLMTAILDSHTLTVPSPYFIADYAGITGASWHGRANFLKRFKTIKMTYGPPKAFILIGGSRIINAAMKMAQKKMGLPLFFAANLEEALAIVRQLENPPPPAHTTEKTTGKTPPTLEAYEDEIMDYIGSLTWDVPGTQLKNIEEHHPFKSVFDAISLIKLDVDELLLESKSAQQEAEFANNAKSQFLANISHEIRTPLNGILGMTDLLLKDNLSEAERRDHLKDIQYSGENLMEIISEILDFSKIEAGKISLDHKPFLLSEACDRALLLLNLKANERNLMLSCHVDPEIPNLLVGDPTRIRQVLINLIGNALKFTQAGEVQLSIHKKSETDGAVRLEFAVSDTGVGIPPDKLAVIFEKFSQVDNSFTRQHSGTGLGLAIVQSLVQLMGGTIQVESQMGCGSRFFFEISLDKPQQDQLLEMTQPAIPMVENMIPQLNILLAEDNVINRKLVERYLKIKNWDVVHAPNGKDAVRLYQESLVDIILMDIQMPEMDGYEATRRIRQLEEGTGRHVPIIALTAHALDSYMRQSISSGMDDYLTKPIHPEEMYRVILHLTGHLA